METIFSKIVRGEIPSYKIAEDDKFYAFLDIEPVQKGHTLVIPKNEVDYIFDIDDDELGEYMIFAKRVAKAIKQVIPCKKIGMAVIGLDVNHAHIHLIPMNVGEDMNFKLTQKFSDEEMQNCAKLIASKFK